MLKETERRAREARLGTRIVHHLADATRLPLRSGSCDASRAERLFQHLSIPPPRSRSSCALPGAAGGSWSWIRTGAHCPCTARRSRSSGAWRACMRTICCTTAMPAARSIICSSAKACGPARRGLSGVRAGPGTGSGVHGPRRGRAQGHRSRRHHTSGAATLAREPASARGRRWRFLHCNAHHGGRPQGLIPLGSIAGSGCSTGTDITRPALDAGPWCAD
jgi:hypothetical protein